MYGRGETQNNLNFQKRIFITFSQFKVITYPKIIFKILHIYVMPTYCISIDAELLTESDNHKIKIKLLFVRAIIIEKVEK